MLLQPSLICISVMGGACSSSGLSRY